MQKRLANENDVDLRNVCDGFVRLLYPAVP